MLDDFSGTVAIIFDMDGVLFLSSGCHEKAFREALADIDIKDFFYASVAGMRTDDAFRKILAENRRSFSDEYLQKIVNKKRIRAQELLAKKGKIATGSAELISDLQKKYRLVLASSASPQTVELFLKKSGYANAFEFCLNGSAVIKSKPDPEIYLLAVNKLNLKPEQCVVIEDAVNGVQSAISANIPVIAIAEEGQKDEFKKLKPAKIISNLMDLEPIFRI